MATFLFAVLTVLVLGAAAYAHWRLPNHSIDRRWLWASRLVLLCVGAAFGWATVTAYARLEGTLLRALVFLCSFGIAHLPAAVILYIKQRRAD